MNLEKFLMLLQISLKQCSLLSVIDVDNVYYKYPDGYRAIKVVSFYVREGEKLGIICANCA